MLRRFTNLFTKNYVDLFRKGHVFKKGTIVHYMGLPCRLMYDTKVYSRTLMDGYVPRFSCKTPGKKTIYRNGY